MKRATAWLGVLLACITGAANAQLAIHHIDVEQGDATLFVLPNGRTLLVDAGLDGRGRVVADYLMALGIQEVDAFVLTHYDSDHMGGVDKMVGRGITVHAWYDRGGWTPGPTCQPTTSQLCQYINTAGSATALHPGWMIDLDAEVTVRVVASNSRVGTLSPYPDLAEENALSVALLVSYRGFNYLLGGDLTAAVEERLVSEAAIGDIDVYHVNHHGSETSSSRPFLELIRPEVAVISAGSHCGFHHPRRSVLEELRRVVIDTYLTNKYLCGDTRGANPPDEFIADLVQAGAVGNIIIEVGPSTYAVVLPGNGARREYPIQRPR